MSVLRWGSPESLQALLFELVSWQSLTGTEGEQAFSHKLIKKLLEVKYFQDHRQHIHLQNAGKNRYAVTALYTSEKTAQTIVLMSHYDTVHIEEYGDIGTDAFYPQKLTEIFMERIATLPQEVQNDLRSGEYLFGRGIMDMKIGIALHMQLLEKATVEQWPINLLFVTVPDEEVNSAGMRAAVPKIVEICKQYQLEITLFLNGEPSFSQYPGDTRHHIYSGSIGKIMPAALFFGKETHAGEPLSGMTGQYIASFLTNKMEWNPAFKETDFEETTPLPITLQQKDLKEAYSTQTSHRTSALYNVFVMKRNADEIMKIYRGIAEEAVNECNRAYEVICQRENIQPIGKVKVIEYQQLYEYSCEKFSDSEVEMFLKEITEDEHLDDREKSIRLVDEMMLHCQELAPIIVLFFAPPYYPAVNTSQHKLVHEKIAFVQAFAKEAYNISLNQIHYFNGISDLSYVNYNVGDEGWQSYIANTPAWDRGYTIPFSEMQQLEAPVLNIGPFGKDAHKLTERLHKENAFVQTPRLLERFIQSFFGERIEKG